MTHISNIAFPKTDNIEMVYKNKIGNYIKLEFIRNK